MNYIITGKNFTSPLLTTQKNGPAVKIMTEAELMTTNTSLTGHDRVYAPDETSVPAICAKLTDENRRKQIDAIKNKYKCRELLKTMYQKLYYTKININDIPKFILPDINKKYFIKPQKGFFGIGVKQIDSKTDLSKLTKQLKEEIKRGGQFFSDEVFTANDFLIEENIEGEEYTFDLFYNALGKPIIVNFCHHPMSAIKDYFHLLYYTCPDIYRKFAVQVKEIFTKLNQNLNIKNLPIHAEFKERNGKLVPIEINIPRFGGFGLADLPYYAYGVNSFECFFEGEEPDWDNTLLKHKGKYYGWVLCYNGTNVNLEKNSPNYGQLKKDLGKILHYYVLDYRKNPAFGIAYVEKNSKESLDRILKIDFRDYFIPNNQPGQGEGQR